MTWGEEDLEKEKDERRCPIRLIHTGGLVLQSRWKRGPSPGIASPSEARVPRFLFCPIR